MAVLHAPVRSMPQDDARTRDTTLADGTPQFRELFEANVVFVWRTLRRLGVAERDLEDEAHEVFVVVHRQLANFDPSKPFRTWLLGICYRRAADYRRLARHRKQELGTVPDSPESGPTTEERYVAQEEERLRWTALASCLDELEEERRTALVLHDLEGLTLAQVAEITGAPVQTVYSRIRAARETLSACAKRRARAPGRTG